MTVLLARISILVSTASEILESEAIRVSCVEVVLKIYYFQPQHQWEYKIQEHDETDLTMTCGFFPLQVCPLSTAFLHVSLATGYSIFFPFRAVGKRPPLPEYLRFRMKSGKKAHLQ